MTEILLKQETKEADKCLLFKEFIKNFSRILYDDVGIKNYISKIKDDKKLCKKYSKELGSFERKLNDFSFYSKSSKEITLRIPSGGTKISGDFPTLSPNSILKLEQTIVIHIAPSLSDSHVMISIYVTVDGKKRAFDNDSFVYKAILEPLYENLVEVLKDVPNFKHTIKK